MIAGKRQAQRGFTLLELMITAAVAVILATVAVPNFQSLVARNRLVADYNEIVAGLNYARGEAIKQRREITTTLAPSADGAWRLQVTQGENNVLLERQARDGAVSIDAGSVSFNALGRRGACEGWDECIFTVSSANDSLAIKAIVARVWLSGHVGKPDDDDSQAES